MVKTVNGIQPPDLYERIRQVIPLGSRVLDVGCGLANYHGHVTERCRELVCVDAFPMYLENAKEKYPQHVRETHLGRAQEVLPTLIAKDEWYDIALAIDFVEHLEKPESYALIEHLKQLAPVVVVFTCDGLHPQDRDWLDHGADFWQTHRSVWHKGDLEAIGFDEEWWPHFHDWALERYKGVEGFTPHALWGVWRMS